jgi:hypothetical protein
MWSRGGTPRRDRRLPTGAGRLSTANLHLDAQIGKDGVGYLTAAA